MGKRLLFSVSSHLEKINFKMKKLQLTVFVSLLTLSCFSQTWFEAAVKGQVGPTFLFNNNVSNDKHVNPELSYGNGFGGRLGVCFNDEHEVMAECLFSTQSQKYRIKLDSSATVIYNKTIKVSTIDIPLLYRHFANGGYVEIGPQMSLVKKATETNTLSSGGASTVLPKISSSYFSGVIGFGANFIGSGPFTLIMGARFAYGFGDMISTVGGRSQTQSYPLSDQYYNSTYTSYKPTNPFSAMLTLEASFDVGYFVSSNCKNNHVRFLSF